MEPVKLTVRPGPSTASIRGGNTDEGDAARRLGNDLELLQGTAAANPVRREIVTVQSEDLAHAQRFRGHYQRSIR